MKTVKVTTDNAVSIIDVDFDDYKNIQRAVGGHFETVRTERMRAVFGDEALIMLVDEDGLLKQLPANMLGCILYGSYVHGHPIVGDLIFAKIAGEDIAAPDAPEKLKWLILNGFVGFKEM